jgi:carbon monoxide dehydrogenase subunit G
VQLEHEFEVAASPAETLALLRDPHRVVPCIPGATLVDVTPDGTWRTTMSVKLGPVGMDFWSDVRILEEAAGASPVKLAVQSRDKRGRGGAEVSIAATLSPVTYGTRVAMATDVSFSGQAAQLGRPSVITDLSKRLVDQFAECLDRQLGSAFPPPVEASAPVNGFALLRAAIGSTLRRAFRIRHAPREGGSA